MMDGLHLLRPYWLCALVPIVLLWWWYGRAHYRDSVWSRVMPAAFVRLLVARNTDGRWWHQPRHLLALACVIAVLALAGPGWRRTPQPVYRNRAALVIAMNLSQSMLAQDITPSRLQRAKLKILDLLSLRDRGDTALVAYAAHAYIVAPLTYDVRTLANLVPALKPGIMPRQGDNPRAAMKLAARLAHSGGRRGGDVLLVTDGLGAENAAKLASFAQQQQLHVSVLAVATPHPSPVPNLGGVGRLREQGQVVTSALQAEPLEALARDTGGRYQIVRRDGQDIRKLQKLFETRHVGIKAVRGRDARQWFDLGPWLLLLLCLPAAACLFRRNFLLLLLVCVMVPMARSRAAGLDSWFLNSNQRGLAAYQKGDYKRADQLFSDSRWRAAAAYKQSDLKTALALYAKHDDLASVYDRGNVLVKLGRFQKALKAYNEVLARDPGNRDAAYNKAQVLKLLKALQHKQRRDESRSDHADKRQNQKQQQKQTGARKSARGKKRKQSESSRRASKKQQGHRRLQDEVEADNPHKNTSASGKARPSMDKRQRDSAEYRLRQIPDDPSGLLRRKFHYEYEHRIEARDRGGAS